MPLIKHYSFDLWFTLIKSNPEFKKQRALFFFNHFNALKKTITEIETVFRNVDLMCNAMNEKTGFNLRSEEMYLLVIGQINEDYQAFSSVDLDSLSKEMNQLFFNYCPVVFSKNTHEVLDKIKQQHTITTNILSNTAFVKGNELRTVLKDLNLEQYFDFQIYSDEVLVSKPNGTIFELVYNTIIKMDVSTMDIEKPNIMHVGDNPIADIKGATDAGFQAFQINTNHLTITDLLS